MSSLTDALLLDPWRDPRDIYIALRSDGQRGDGTIHSPFDGSTRVEPALSATLTFNPKEVIITAVGANYNVGDTVQLINLTGAAASFFEGDLTILEKLDADHFKVELPNIPPAPPAPRPLTVEAYYFRRVTPEGQVVLWVISWPVVAVTTATAHGLAHFDVVTMAGSGDARFHTQSYVAVASATKFYYRLRGTGSLPDPVTSPIGCNAARHVYRFDQVMAAAALPKSAIHIGPGTFETRGRLRWFARNGQRIRGAGIGQTTLKLVHVLPVDQVPIIGGFGGGPFTDGFEASDMTLDCNLPGQAGFFGEPYPVACCAGVDAPGNHIRLRRLRMIHFGTQMPARECFVVYCGPEAAQLAPANRVVEDCILELPSPNNVRETTLIGVAGTGLAPEARAGVVRRCYMDLKYPPTEAHPQGVSSAPVGISAASISSGVVTVTTLRPHGREVGQLAAIFQVAPDGHPLNGLHRVTAVPDELTFQCILPAGTTFPSPQSFNYATVGVSFQGGAALSGTGCVIEGNAFYDVGRAFYTDTGSTRDVVVRDNYIHDSIEAVRFDFSTGFYEEQRAAEILWDSTPGNELIATFVLAAGEAGLGVLPGDVVWIQGVRVAGNVAQDGTYNGIFTVVSVSEDLSQFSYRMRIAPVNEPDAPDDENNKSILLRALYQVRRMVYEGNVFTLTPFNTNPEGHPNGISSLSVAALEGDPVFTFPGAVIRDNVCGHTDPGSHEPISPSAALAGLSSFENTIIDGNIIAFEGDYTTGADRPVVVRHRLCQAITAFNNVSPAGRRLGLFEVTTSGAPPTIEERDTVETKVADALLMAFL